MLNSAGRKNGFQKVFDSTHDQIFLQSIPIEVE